VAQVTFDAASHVIDRAKILKTVTTTKLAVTRVANANTIRINVHLVHIKVVSVADQVPDSAVVPPVVAADPAVATWSLTVQRESRDTMDLLSRLTRVSNLKWTKWTVSPGNAQSPSGSPMLSEEKVKISVAPLFHQHPTQTIWLDTLLISTWTPHQDGAMVIASTGRQTHTQNASLTRFKLTEPSTGEPCSMIPSTLMTI